MLLWSALAVLAIGGLCNGFSLGHYPTFYRDDAFFAYPALKAAQGGTLTYQVSSSAPYARELWAYHGPLFPHILPILFRTLGFSTTVARLPDFAGAWLAVLVIVVFLARRGYGVAALVLAILWCGDRAPQEVMYGRMDGLALLFLTLTFVLAAVSIERESVTVAGVAGALCGTACLLNPLCALFGIASIGVLLIRRRVRESLAFALGGLCNVPVLLWLWGFHVHDALAQFLWHAHRLQSQASAWQSFVRMLVVLNWSRYWFVTLCGFALWMIADTARRVFRAGLSAGTTRPELLLLAAFSLAALPIIFRRSTHPYYIVYFSLWAMSGLALFLQVHWKRYRALTVLLVAIWLSSAAWNGLRFREDVMFHRGLNERALVGMIQSQVPGDKEIVATPELYAVPPEAGHWRFHLTTWFHERRDVCPTCYVLMTESQFAHGDYVLRANLNDRRVLFDGPAFPGTGPLAYPIVLLSPEDEGGGM